VLGLFGDEEYVFKAAECDFDYVLVQKQMLRLFVREDDQKGLDDCIPQLSNFLVLFGGVLIDDLEVAVFVLSESGGILAENLSFTPLKRE
jgi:hypothetical protein